MDLGIQSVTYTTQRDMPRLTDAKGCMKRKQEPEEGTHGLPSPPLGAVVAEPVPRLIEGLLSEFLGMHSKHFPFRLSWIQVSL